VSGAWVKKDVIAYLFVETINKKAIDALSDHAINCKYFNFLESNTDLYPIEYGAIYLLREKYPTKYEMLRIPVLWERGDDLDIHIDVPMNLLFLGITKSLVRMIQAWCTLRGSTEVLHSMSQGFCRVLTNWDCRGLFVYLTLVPNSMDGFLRITYLLQGSVVGSIRSYQQLLPILNSLNLEHPRRIGQ
jgi:hypothetical protein